MGRYKYIDNNGNSIGAGTRITKYDPLNKIATEHALKRFIAFDTETTGLNDSDRIIELGAVLYENGIKVKEFNTLINAGVPNSPGAEAVNHISQEMLNEAPKENEAYRAFLDFIEEGANGKICILAHNAKFDMNFLKGSLDRLGFNNTTLSYMDTLEMARKMLSLPNYKQDTVAGHFGIVNKCAHRATEDADTCAKMFVKMANILLGK